MKLHAHLTPALNTITGYGPDWIAIHGVRYPHAVWFAPEGPVQGWPPHTASALEATHFEALAKAAPNLVLIGTGARQHFLPPRVLAPLHAAHIGVETMDTGAACRTYNILLAEGRRVIAALLPSAA